MPNFLFDARLDVTFRLDAPDEAAARHHLRMMLDMADVTFGSLHGEPITSEVTLNFEPVLVEEEGEAIGDPSPADIEPKAGETVVGSTATYRIFENAHGFRLVRVADAMEATWYGDDACEDFRDQFKGDDNPYGDQDIAENAEATDDFGRWAEWRGALRPRGRTVREG